MILLSSRDKCDGPVVATKLQRRAHGTSIYVWCSYGYMLWLPCSLFSTVAKDALRPASDLTRYADKSGPSDPSYFRRNPHSFIVYRHHGRGLALLYSYTLSSGDPIYL